MFAKIKEFLLRNKKTKEADRAVFWVMLVFSAIALAAAFTLTVEKFHLYEEPNAVLSCSINIVLNCSAVMETWQASVLGFPNMVFGLIAYAVLVTVAVVGLAGAKLPRWFWIATNVGVLGGLIFSYWLFFQSLYDIQILCPWCLLVTSSTTFIFAAITYYNLKHNIFNLKGEINTRVQAFLNGGYLQMVVLAWLALMVALVFLQFGSDLFA